MHPYLYSQACGEDSKISLYFGYAFLKKNSKKKGYFGYAYPKSHYILEKMCLRKCTSETNLFF